MSSLISPSSRVDEPLRHGSCEIVDESTIKKSKSGEMSDVTSTAGSADSRFSCNICFDEVSEPVVTRCGHLYCWPCLFQWLEPGMNQEERESLGLSSFRYGGRNPSRRVCPVCKAGCPLSAVVPLYIRSSPVRSSRSKPISSGHTNDEMDPKEMDLSEPENDANSTHFESGIGAADEGLRRRRASHISDDSNNESERVSVPNRPSFTQPQHRQEEPSSPPMSRRSSPGSSPRSRASTDNPYRTGSVQLTPRSPNGHNGSLTYGIISSLQRATAEYYRNNTNNADDSERRQIPSLHDQRNPLRNHNADGTGRFADSPQEYSYYGDGDGALNSETTQYLTRLLIMLTSFVIFCFLLV
mmetsp:Transcript_60/g.135  ORF Transcript_60/g.135 Transcript_60/m.135 type:complete len:355 (-) Transcript_60:402-1466(-)